MAAHGLFDVKRTCESRISSYPTTDAYIIYMTEQHGRQCCLKDCLKQNNTLRLR